MPIRAFPTSVVPVLLVRQYFICPWYLSLTVPLTDGKTPEGISQTAAGNSLPTTNNNSAALQSLALWDGLTILTGLGIFLTVLL
jgi:hypothetical protein